MERFAGRYTLVRPLGQGGMGQVWLALDHTTARECALKRLERRLPRSERDSLRREFEVLARVRHPAVVSVLELGFAADGTPFYTMECVPGLAADAALSGSDWAALYAVAARVADGLEALHAAGIVHGDVKPSNLLVLPPSPANPTPDVRLVDFGLAALLDRDARGHRGTPGYAAPEVVRGTPLSVASDLYSLGATLHVIALAVARGDEPARPARPPADVAAAATALDQAGVPAPLSQLILRLLDAEPSARPASARAVRIELAHQHPAARRALAERLRAERIVGRGAELARLERWLATSGGGTLVLLSGEPGVGKSMLLRELAVRASLAGREVIALSSAPGEAPGALARTLLLRLAAAAAADAADRTGPLGRLESDSPLRESDLAALAEAALAWARDVHARSGGVLVLVDEFEHVEGIARALFRRLVSNDTEGLLRWVWASAPAPERASNADDLLVEAGLAERMTLGTLEREAFEQLLTTRLQAESPAGLADALWEHGGGHPGFTVEMLEMAAERGALREIESGLALDRAALVWPGDFGSAWLERLARLSEPARAAAAALAAFGAPLDAAGLAAIEPLADAAALGVLASSGLLHVTEDGRQLLHPPALARQLLETLPEDERRRRFRAALAHPGLAAEQRFRLRRGAGEPERALEEALAAFELGGDIGLVVEAAALASEHVPAQAAVWAARAGEQLLRRGRYREARPHLERALALEPSAAESADREFLLSSVYLRVGELGALEELLSRTLARPLAERDRARMLVNLSALHLAKGETASLPPVALEARTLAERSGDPAAHGLALVSASNCALSGPEGPVAAMSYARQAVAEYTRAGDANGRLRAVVVVTHALWAERRNEEAIAMLREALVEARRLDLRLALSELLRSLSLHLNETGAWPEARATEEQALRLAIEEGWPGLAALSLVTLVLYDALLGETTRARRNIGRTHRLVRRYQRHLEPTALRAFAITWRACGRVRRAERCIRASLALSDRGTWDLEWTWGRIESGLVLTRSGRWQEASRVWEAGLAESHGITNSGYAVLTALTGRAAVRAGELSEAQQRLEAAEQWLAAHPAPFARGFALQLRAELALARGEVTAAAAGVDETLRALDALPAVAEAAMAALEFARLAERHGLWAHLPIPEWLRRSASGFDVTGDRASQGHALALAVEWYRRHSGATRKGERDRDLLQAVGRLLDSMSDLGQLTRAAMKLAVEQLDAERGVLLLAEGELDGEDHELKPVVEHGAVDSATRDQAITYSRKVVRIVRHRGGAVVIPDARTEAESMSHSVVELGLRSILCVPLFVESRVVGAVYLDDSRRAEAFGDAERKLLEGFAHLLAVAIENSRGQEQVRLENAQLVGENLSLRREASARFRPHNIIGGSLALQRVLATVERAARTSSNVLITGENGTGKELIAKLLHHSGPRSLKPFVAVNCAAIVPTLLESELFGIAADVATGVKARPGRFLEANGGTLFLDEIGDMPMAQQVKLLRALAERAVNPVGESRAIPVDVRIIAATNRDLQLAIAEARFREDLWYRLNVIPIEMPALRERKADIPALAHHFAAMFAAQQEREVPTLAPGLIAVLMQSDWPGNVRELQNYVERLMAMTPGKVLHPEPLPHDLQQRAMGAARPERGRSLEELVAELEKRHVLEALDRHAGNQSRAARELGLTEQSLRYRLRKYALPTKRHFQRVR